MNYFKRKEFECSCGCGFAAVDYELLGILNKIREEKNVPLVITSGCRCESYNVSVGGARNSLHVRGLAVDFRVSKNISDWEKLTTEIHEELLKQFPDKYGIARKEKSFIHLDVKPGNARRWKY